MVWQMCSEMVRSEKDYTCRNQMEQMKIVWTVWNMTVTELSRTKKGNILKELISLKETEYKY